MLQKNIPTQIPSIHYDGGEMPKLGLGTWELKGKSCSQIVEMALNIGYRHIDTARMYENEKAVGRGLADSGLPREDFFLTSKVFRDSLAPKDVRTSCEASLKDLGTDHLDLLLIHWPNDAVPLADTLGAMSDLRVEGKIRHLGVSNFTSKLLQEAAELTDSPIFCNQVEFHPLLDQRKLLACQYDLDIPLVAHSPLAQGRILRNRVLIDIAKKYELSPVQLALHWITQHERVAAVPKTSSETHLHENLDIFSIHLERDDIEAIDALQGNDRCIDPDWAPEWDVPDAG